MKKEIVIHTDGACNQQKGFGGYCSILKLGEYIKVFHGGRKHTTNNKMELLAILIALKSLKDSAVPYNITLYTDSNYCVQIFNDYIKTWEVNGWKKKGGIKNLDIIKEIYELTKKFKVRILKIKGHDGEKYNEFCDHIAVLNRTTIERGAEEFNTVINVQNCKDEPFMNIYNRFLG